MLYIDVTKTTPNLVLVPLFPTQFPTTIVPEH